MKFGLKPETVKKIQDCLSQFEHIDQAIIYGSRALGKHRPGSDIDLTLRGNKLTYTDLAKLENKIDDLLLPYKFDFSIFHAIDNQELVDHIERVGVPFYAKSEPLQNR